MGLSGPSIPCTGHPDQVLQALVMGLEIRCDSGTQGQPLTGALALPLSPIQSSSQLVPWRLPGWWLPTAFK